MSIGYAHENIRETHILGVKTQFQVIKADESDNRDWLADTPICDKLKDNSIAHCGIMQAAFPFEIVRVNLSGTFFLACFEGEGSVLIDGSWQTVVAGQACVQPPFIPNALRAVKGKLWKFCWVRYQETTAKKSVAVLHAPTLGAFDVSPFRCAIEGLHAEVSSSKSTRMAIAWSELIHCYVHSFAQIFQDDDRLVKVCRAIERNLKGDWTLERLANTAHVSKEHLRRLCSASFGRSPMQHVAFLRMQYAARLLRTTDHKIASIAHQVGYANQFSFSDTFQRWLGCRPSAYREQGNRK